MSSYRPRALRPWSPSGQRVRPRIRPHHHLRGADAIRVCEVQLRDSKCGGIGLGRIAVCEENHRKGTLRIAHDDAAEADRLTGMPHGFPRDTPSEAVANIRIIARS